MIARTLSAILAATAAFAGPAFADKLDEVKERGVFKCGILPGKAGFATPDETGVWQGSDID